MGIDIYLVTDNDELSERLSEAYDWHRWALSRTFCNLVSAGSMFNPKLEIDQLGELTGIDIQPLHEMITYSGQLWPEWELEEVDEETERQDMLRQTEKAKTRLSGNVDRVLATVEGLLGALAIVDNLPAHLDDEQGRLDNTVYFADFLKPAGEGELDHLDNNFGQDLRAFRYFLLLVKQHGGTTVYFEWM
ncbi:hypothetical protein [Hymenobacter guriensis]|uniref:DUF1877 family protein n=1 Tax=Hymenobacter guriensis TaxID=2793065 RepID=A0ABS0KXF0_9BACT|nr:hypothetical protein [Hymenobacter guriensis]MBG8552550.1 hypothetical protein [Hymenobacter guriensis]